MGYQKLHAKLARQPPANATELDECPDGKTEAALLSGTYRTAISGHLSCKRCRVIAAQNGGSARSYQRGLRDVGSQQTGGRLNMQPSSLMNIHASQFCAKNARTCRDDVVASWG